MKKLILFAGLALGVFCFGPMQPVFADTFTAMDSNVVQISSSMITGATKILTASQANASNVFLYVPATAGVTGEQFVIGSSVSLSTAATNGNGRLPVNTLIPLADYKGAIWAIAVGTSPLNVSVIRKK